ncbi:hypothetical protein HRbin22_00891 [Candidatus Thermoflexus japonica]|uniref:Uncharacterized protein n=1 Tax=Candidatus Thermoflexus japonica TaxID=2035417 RepID=A0A2H5Y5E2_9CHLR|nr:hypothetical protein HRbin22_00891 [Candidatus Thermoflexus japonica]
MSVPTLYEGCGVEILRLTCTASWSDARGIAR